MVNVDALRNLIFETINFNYDKKIIVKQSDKLMVSYDADTANIEYYNISSLCRAFFLFAKNFKKGDFKIEEKANFDMCGCMIDASRDAVMKVEAVKKYMNYMASLGLNMLMLYTEDTYKLDDYEYFGYMRGAYTRDELKEIDNYGTMLGIEVIPCIQTLAHLSQYLKYDETSKFRDTHDILLCGDDNTYKFIEAQIKTVSEIFTSNKIHIGMDEAHNVGLGQFLDKFGYQERYNIIINHLNKVCEICKKYKLEPMMWNDMFFRTCTPDKDYYNYKQAHFNKEILSNIPDVDMVYWDYYHDDKATYEGMINKSIELGKKVIFAGGISTWYGFLPHYKFTVNNSIAGLKAACESNVKTCFATMWGDDGNETNIFFSLGFLPIFSEFCYKGLKCTFNDIIETSEFLTKMPFELLKTISNYNTIIDNKNEFLGKNLFYADIMYNLGPNGDVLKSALNIYNSALEKFDKYEDFKDCINTIEYSKTLFKITKTKIMLRMNLRKAYKKNDFDYLKETAYTILPNLKNEYLKFKNIHKKQWDDTYKPFGYEVLSFRFGGIISRIDDCIQTLNKYISGEISNIAEFDEKLLDTNNYTYRSSKRCISPSIIL